MAVPKTNVTMPYDYKVKGYSIDNGGGEGGGGVSITTLYFYDQEDTAPNNGAYHPFKGIDESTAQPIICTFEEFTEIMSSGNIIILESLADLVTNTTDKYIATIFEEDLTQNAKYSLACAVDVAGDHTADLIVVGWDERGGE